MRIFWHAGLSRYWIDTGGVVTCPREPLPYCIHSGPVAGRRLLEVLFESVAVGTDA